MARKQMTIPGTGRKEHPEIEAAADEYREARDERMELSKKEKLKKMALIAVMQAHKVKKYKFDDGEGEELAVVLEDKVDVSVRKTGEAESAIGEGISSGEGGEGGIPRGLIDQAMKGQADINVEETAGGDIVVPETSAPKTKKKGKKKS